MVGHGDDGALVKEGGGGRGARIVAYLHIGEDAGFPPGRQYLCLPYKNWKAPPPFLKLW